MDLDSLLSDQPIRRSGARCRTCRHPEAAQIADWLREAVARKALPITDPRFVAHTWRDVADGMRREYPDVPRDYRAVLRHASVCLGLEVDG